MQGGVFWLVLLEKAVCINTDIQVDIGIRVLLTIIRLPKI
jgi:hypothetical protein